MRDYFHDRFPIQLQQIPLRRPNDVVRGHIMRDESVVFFGGQDWRNVASDLRRVPPSDQVKFILSLFMIVLTDQCLYTYFQHAYIDWKRITNFPKFGWAGFGPHVENPFKLLWAPEREGLVDPNDAIEVMPQFVDFLLTETDDYFANRIPNVDRNHYYNSIRQDSAYEFNEGNIIPSFKESFQLATDQIDD